jgi:hypothetical protein
MSSSREAMPPKQHVERFVSPQHADLVSIVGVVDLCTCTSFASGAAVMLSVMLSKSMLK